MAATMATSPERRRRMFAPDLFARLGRFAVRRRWAIVFGIGLQLVPHEGANSPYGGLGLIMMFTGFFIMMGFIWSVIGE